MLYLIRLPRERFECLQPPILGFPYPAQTHSTLFPGETIPTLCFLKIKTNQTCYAITRELGNAQYHTSLTNAGSPTAVAFSRRYRLQHRSRFHAQGWVLHILPSPAGSALSVHGTRCQYFESGEVHELQQLEIQHSLSRRPCQPTD